MGITKSWQRVMAVHVLALALSGCPASSKLNEGALDGPVDLEAKLPPDVLSAMAKAGADATTVHRDTILVGPKCAPVEVEWRTVQSGQGKYLLSAKARLLEPVKYDSLTFALQSEAANLGTKVAPIEARTFELKWSMSNNHGTTTAYVRADNGAINPHQGKTQCEPE